MQKVFPVQNGRVSDGAKEAWKTFAPWARQKKRNPLQVQEVFGLFGPEVHLGVSLRVSPKIGVCPKVSGEVPLGPF